MGSQQSLVSKQKDIPKPTNLLHCSLNTLLINNGILPKTTVLEALKTAYENNLIKIDIYAYLLHDRTIWCN
jgi:hypothetical protein